MNRNKMPIKVALLHKLMVANHFLEKLVFEKHKKSPGIEIKMRNSTISKYSFVFAIHYAVLTHEKSVSLFPLQLFPQ